MASISDNAVEFSQLATGSEEAADGVDALAGSNGQAAEAIDEATEELKKQIEALRQVTQASISSVAELNQISATLASGQFLSAQAVADLILKYPELASQIRKTTDGWIFEGQILEKLRQAKIKKSIDDIRAERDSTKTAALESLRRIQYYGTEFAAITSFAEARQKLAEIETGIVSEEKKAADLNKSNLMTQGMANLLQQKANEQMEAKRQKVKEINDVINQYAGQLQLSNDQIEAMTKLLNDDTLGVEDNNKARKETVEIMTDLQKAIEGYNKSLEKLDSQQKRVAKSSKEYLDILAEKRKALLEEQKLYEQGYNDPSQLVSSQTEITTGGGTSSDITRMLSTAVDLANSGVMRYKKIGGEFTGSFDDFKQRAYSDCSQFVQEMFETIGVQVPRTAAQQAKAGTAVSKKNLQVGDLVFFNTNGKDNSHVGIYMGDSKFIQMGESGLKVSDLNSSYWAPKYNGATRIPGLSTDAAYPTSSSSQTTSGGVAYAGKYASEINAAANRFNVDPYLVAAVIQRESTFGAKGVTNVMQVNGMNNATVKQSIDAGTKMLSELLKKSGGDVAMALGGYNMGSGIIDWFKKSGGYNKADMAAYSEKYKKVYKSKVYGDVGYVDKVLADYSPQKSSTTTQPTQKQLKDAKNTADSELLRISDDLYNIDVSELESKLGIKDMKVSDKELALKQSESRQKNMKKDSKEYKDEYELQLKLKTEIQKLMQEQRQMIEQSGLKSDELTNKRRSLTEKIGDVQSEKEDMKDQYASDQFDTAQANMEARVERMRQQGRSEMEMTKTQLQFYQGQLKNTALTEEQRVESAKQVYDLTNKVTDLKFKNSTSWIDKQTDQMERQGKSEVEIYQMQAEAYNRMRNDTTLKAEQRAEAEKMYQDTSKKLISSRYEYAYKWITKEATKMEMSGAQKVDIMKWEL